MTPEAYQGLFYLSSGIGLFVALLLGFRILGSEFGKNEGAKSGSPTDQWSQKEPLEVIEIIDETHDIKTFRFRRMSGKDFPSFKAGQFLSFQIGDNEKVLRSYSIASVARPSATLQVAIKRLNGGLGSEWFHSLKVGDQVIAYPPAGLFVDDNGGDGARVYVAGGIGITPILSMIETNLEAGSTFPMYLFYGMRSVRDLAYHDYLQYLANRHRRLTYVPVLMEKDASWTGAAGFVTASLIQEHTSLASAPFVFMCGPTPMTDGLHTQFEAAGLDLERVHVEKFASPADLDRSKIPMKTVSVSWNGDRHQYSGNDTLLEFLETKSVSIPYACRVGVCGTCKCKATGKVNMVTDAGLNTLERRAGMILPCVAFPLEDVELSS